MDPSTLTVGPRGRRLLLQFALDSEERAGGYALARAVWDADEILDPEPRAGARYVELPEIPADTTDVTYTTAPTVPAPPVPDPDPVAVARAVDAAARALEAVRLIEATWETIRHPLADAVALARCWQAPEGRAVLLEREEMRGSLERIARHLAAAPVTREWSAAADPAHQVAMLWEGADPVPVRGRSALAAAREHLREMEIRAHRERASDPRASISGEWWSAPRWPSPVPHTTTSSPDGSPYGALLVEDAFNWATGESIGLGAPEGLRILELDSAEVWADLCRRFPLDVTAQRRHDWYRVTGRDGAWVIPDWAAVAAEYDAVHLPISGYLELAGRAIPVTDDTASVIAGWDPDATYWFTDRVRFVGARRRWSQHVEATDIWWAPSR